MGGRGISVGAVALAGAGVVTVWAALKGASVAGGLRAVLAGHPVPAGEDLQATAELVGAEGGGSMLGRAASGLLAGSTVVAAATGYLGGGYTYRWGGGSPDGWDCSGFVNWAICHDAGLAIPGYSGGTFSGRGHGPVTGQWALWSGCAGISRDQVQAGDLVVWPLRHMGIAVDAQTMVHAPGPNGTPAPVLGRIDGHLSLGPVLYRRLTGRR